jgi:hypothetical protein
VYNQDFRKDSAFFIVLFAHFGPKPGISRGFTSCIFIFFDVYSKTKTPVFRKTMSFTVEITKTRGRGTSWANLAFGPLVFQKAWFQGTRRSKNYLTFAVACEYV